MRYDRYLEVSVGKKKAVEKAERKLEKLKGRLRAQQAYFIDLHAVNRRGFSLLGDIGSSLIKLVLASGRGDLFDVKKREAQLMMEVHAFEAVVGEIYEIGRHLGEKQYDEERSNGSAQDAAAN